MGARLDLDPGGGVDRRRHCRHSRLISVISSSSSERRRPVLGAAALLLAALVAGGCVAHKPRGLSPGPDARVLPGVPVRSFGIDNCGPGALSAVLNHHGDPVTLEELEERLPRGRNEGVLSLDLVLEARRRGFDARVVEGSPGMVEGELLEGRPVILMLKVLQTFGLGYDLFHYAVLDGIDPGRGLVRIHLGDEKPRWTTLERLERMWGPTRRATLVISPDGAVAEHGRRNALRFAVALEEAGRAEEAIALYRGLLEEEPDSVLLWTNLGNAQVGVGELAAAEISYRRALELDPGDWRAANNLAWLLLQDGELEEAEALARQAVARADRDAWLALDTLARVLEARGRCQEAEETFTRALEEAPEGADGSERVREAEESARRECSSHADQAG